MKNKWAEITATIVTTYAVELEAGETLEDAIRYVIDDMPSENWIDFQKRMAADDAEAEAIKRHADRTLRA